MVTASNAPRHHSLRSGFSHYNTGSDKIRALRVARGTPDTTNGVKHQSPRSVPADVCEGRWGGVPTLTAFFFTKGNRPAFASTVEPDGSRLLRLMSNVVPYCESPVYAPSVAHRSATRRVSTLGAGRNRLSRCER